MFDWISRRFYAVSVIIAYLSLVKRFSMKLVDDVTAWIESVGVHTAV